MKSPASHCEHSSHSAESKAVVNNCNSLVSLDRVSLNFGEKPILDNVSLSVSQGEIVTLIGPNGAGKSSLVKLITGLYQPSQGKIFRRADLTYGYVPQKLKINPNLPMSVDRFLHLASHRKLSTADVAKTLKITHLQSSSMASLSGGELQRVMLARALLREPDLLVLDEPAQGIDVPGQAELYRLIADLRYNLGCGVVMVSHDLHLVMAQTDTVYCVNRHVCCQGEPESVSQHPEYLQLFGKEAAGEIAIYTHDHDHHHHLDGQVVNSHHQCSHD